MNSDKLAEINDSDTPNPAWLAGLPNRLGRQIKFLIAIDALKSINRANRLINRQRAENSAEHSWHLTLFAQILSEYANQPVSVERVVLMLMVHDIVEIDAGDVPLHGVQNPQTHALELAAADRLFGLLPEDQGTVLRECWEEFEAGESNEAQFAKAVDRLQPVLLNALNNGGTWSTFNVTLQQVQTRCASISNGSDRLWEMANAIFNEATRNGWLKTTPPTDWT